MSDEKETCYICGNDATGSDQTMIEDGIPLRICKECGGGSCGPIGSDDIEGVPV